MECEADNMRMVIDHSYSQLVLDHEEMPFTIYIPLQDTTS